MAKTMDILQEIRRDFAEITGILLYLQNLRRFSESQSKAIDSALQGFSYIVVQYIGGIRKSFGERLWYRLEDIDKPPFLSSTEDTGAEIIMLVKDKAKELNKKLLNLPGEDKCTDVQLKQINLLFEGLKHWRNENLALLKMAFE